MGNSQGYRKDRARAKLLTGKSRQSEMEVAELFSYHVGQRDGSTRDFATDRKCSDDTIERIARAGRMYRRVRHVLTEADRLPVLQVWVNELERGYWETIGQDYEARSSLDRYDCETIDPLIEESMAWLETVFDDPNASVRKLRAEINPTKDYLATGLRQVKQGIANILADPASHKDFVLWAWALLGRDILKLENEDE